MTFFENTQQLINEAAKVAGISGNDLVRLQKLNNILNFQIPVKLDNGQTVKFEGWRVQHNNALGPYKGGIRFHPDASLDEVEALASLMTWKTSVAGIPYGGGKGAVKVDPKKLSRRELEELSRGYVRAIWQNLGPRTDVPAPDVNTNAEILDWMTDEYSKLVGHWEPAAFTGKSVEKGGSEGREVATGFGGYVILRELLKLRPEVSQQGTRQLSVAIQGFGNVGSNIAKILFYPRTQKATAVSPWMNSDVSREARIGQSHTRKGVGVYRGFKIVGISDSKGALYEPNGININKVLAVKEKTGIIDRALCYAMEEHGAPCQAMSNEELLELDVDILIPAALENQITESNADAIKAKIILEMANGPTTPEADVILGQRGIEIIPDILANAGGVVGSYFEWIQSLDQNYWNEEEVLNKIDAQLTEAFRAIAETKEQYKTSWRLAAYIYGIKRVAEAMKKPA